MLSEMLGELNVSHAGSGYRGASISNADATASLGIFMNYNYNGNGILIDEIIKGGPLDKSKFKVKAGMVIEKINGETIDKDQDVAKYLNRMAGTFMLLEVLDPNTKKAQTITVKPISLGAENGLLYKRWVKINEKEVDKASNGQLGYVHIPGMGDGPYRSIYQDMMGKFSDRKGVVVDTRFNGGGDLVADLAMFFSGTPFITYATAEKVVGGEPTSRWTKPTLSIFNESMYSDGHCYASGYTDLKIAKFPFGANGKAVSMMETDGFVKMIADGKTNVVLGVHIVGPEASNLISEAALAIEMGATLEDISLTIHPHPTLGETMMEAAEATLGHAIHVIQKKRN